jgi:hypothetical protein
MGSTGLSQVVKAKIFEPGFPATRSKGSFDFIKLNTPDYALAVPAEERTTERILARITTNTATPWQS